MSAPPVKIVFLDAATYGDVSLKRFTDAWSCTIHQVTANGETTRRLAGHSIAVTNKVPFDKNTLSAPEARAFLGDARYPVIGGKAVPGMDILHSSLSLSPRTHSLTVTMKVANLKAPRATAARIPGTQLLEYVTRWQMGKTLFYAGMSMTASGSRSFYAGRTRTVDLCSVSACFPHVLIYAESGQGGKREKGKVSCPRRPSAKHPCTLVIHVAIRDVGKPKPASVLQEVGAYAFATSHPQGTTTNAQAQADNVPLELDGACCYDFSGLARRHGRHHLQSTHVPRQSGGFTG